MLFEDTYRTIEKTSQGIFKDKGSKFIALAIPATTEQVIKEKIEEVKKQFHDARHHCYAYVLGPDKSAYRYNDDGEPSGTAGRPIYGQIQSFDLTNILIVVVRYFGGTKLGVSGLINAYKTAAKEALITAAIKELTVKDVYSIKFEYPLMNEVMRIIKEDKLEVVKQDFQMSCEVILQVRKRDSNIVFERFNIIHGVKIGYLKTI